MTIAAMVAELTHAGIRLHRHGDRLHVEAKPGTVTPAIRARMAASKADLLAFLDSPDTIRTRLLALAAAERLPASVVDTIPADELPLYADTDDDSLRWCLHLRACCQLCGGNDRQHNHREAT